MMTDGTYLRNIKHGMTVEIVMKKNQRSGKLTWGVVVLDPDELDKGDVSMEIVSTKFPYTVRRTWAHGSCTVTAYADLTGISRSKSWTEY
jgi:hypothetical protein